MLQIPVLLFLFTSVASIPIDNGVYGEPKIECLSDKMVVSVHTKNKFQGNMFVKGHFANDLCKVTATGAKSVSILLKFDECGVKRVRSLNPKGIFVQSSITVSFHPNFVTKVDRAYNVQCFYMEADKTVSSNIDVSDLTAPPDFVTTQAPMPICSYEVLNAGPDGRPVQYALVGQMVYHKWTCTTESIDLFCMTVHSCVASDGLSRKVTYVDQNGCATDPFVLQDIEYLTDLMGGREAHVFKYADVNQLYFDCQITIQVKEPGAACPRPACNAGGILLQRLKRGSAMLDSDAVLDVSTHITSLNLNTSESIAPIALEPLQGKKAQLCLPVLTGSILLSILLITTSSSITVSIYLINKLKRNK